MCYYFIGDNMRITKYQKSKKNTYLVTIDNNDYLLFDDIIVKYTLLLKKEITKKELEMVLKDNQELKCYYKALDYLSKKMRTKKEVKKYLEKNEFNKEEINKTITKLTNEKYLDEESYLNAYISDSLRFSNDGSLKIKQKLINLGLNKELIISKLNAIDTDIWQDKCDKLSLKKLKSNNKDSKQVILLKIKNYLINNGYEIKYINNSLSKLNIETNFDNLEKEYNKLKIKLSKKYEGSNLDFQIKMKLLNKGYTNEEIVHVINL